MKRQIIAIAAVLAVVSLASACGADSSKNNPGGPGASDTIASKMIMGGPAEWQTRPQGAPGLKKTYGVAFGKFTVTDAGGPVTVNQLKNGQIDAADLFTTDPSIEAENFVVLTDPKSNFAAQNIVPIINKDKATAEVRTTLDAISAKLDTPGLSALDSKVITDKQNPADVAKDWLGANGLDQPGTALAGQKLTIGSANFQENVLLANIYAVALKTQGADISTNLNIGSREKYFPGLEDGSIDLIPEYTGNTLAYLDKSATASSPDAVYTALQKALPPKLAVLDKSPAQNSDAVVVTKKTAEKYKLTSIGDLAKKAS